MISNKPDQEKPSLIILDFDGTIFHNPTNDFSFDIPLYHVLDAYTFFNEFMFQTSEIVLNSSEFILISGRNQNQKEIIAHLLRIKGYRIDQSFFNQMDRTTPIDEDSFMIKYWTAKVKLINELKLSNRYTSITVIEDDNVICSMLQKLNFTVYKAQITKNNADQSLTIEFSLPQARFMTELETILNPQNQKTQKKPLVEIV